MKDKLKRGKGKYTETFTKERNSIIYTKIETIIVGREYEVMNIQNEYNPGIKYPETFEDI